MTVTGRGTSNRNQTGSAANRRARKRWLVETYRADEDLLRIDSDDARAAFDRILDEDGPGSLRLIESEPVEVWAVPAGLGVAACRCYRCGRLLTARTVECDRIVPGAVKTARYPKGGTYVRENIRPACGGPGGCNIITGNQLRWGTTPPARHDTT